MIQSFFTSRDVTEEFLKENDGKLDWTSDWYLKQREGAKDYYPNMYKVLNKIVEMKESMKESGYKFKH